MGVSTRVLGLSAVAALGVAGAAYFAFGTGETKTGTAAAIDGSVAPGPVDVDGLRALLPAGVSVSFGAETYDDASGKTTLTDLKITFNDADDRGLAIGEVVIAGFAEDFVKARIDGTNFSQSAVILDYLEARNVSIFGLETLYAPLTEAYLKKLDELAEDISGEDVPDIEQSIDKLDYKIDKILIDDFELLPFVLEKNDNLELDEGAEAFRLLQTFIAYNRAVGAKTVSMQGLSAQTDFTQDGQDMKMSFGMPVIQIEGWRGGDTARLFAENMTFDAMISLPELAEDGAPFEALEMDGVIASYSFEDIRLDEVFSWVARGELPPRTQTDLMSLGVSEIKGMSLSLFDTPFYSVESSRTDLSQFHWLIPTRITQKTENFVYGFGGLFQAIYEVVPEAEKDDEIELFIKTLDVLEAYDLAAPSVDIDFNWVWDPEGGPASLSFGTGLDGYGTMSFDMYGVLGGFEAWVAAFEEGEITDDEEAFIAFVSDNFALSDVAFEMTDRGGNDRLFQGAIEVAKVLKDDVPELGVLAVYDVDTLKLLASSSITGGAEFGAKQFPALREYAKALAAYVKDGGAFKVSLTPQSPLTAADFEQLPNIKNGTDAEKFLGEMGFKVVHTAP